MAVDPDRLDRIAATVADIYREAETALTRTVARHLSGDLDRDMQAPAWAERKLGAVRTLRKSARAILAGLQADGSRAIVDAARTAYRAGWRSALEELPRRWFGESDIPEQAAQAVEQVPGYAAVEALAEAVHQDVGKRSANILRDVLDAYREVVTAATGRTLTGASTRRQAAGAAWRRLVDRGLSSFVDRSGRRWQLSSYVEMATRTVTQRAAVSGQTDRLDALGVNLVYVSDHNQECALCRPYEGRILRTDAGPTGEVQVEHAVTGEPVTVDIADTLAAAQAEGFQHPNCRHSVSAFLPGVTQLPEQPTADPDGDQARQRQRQIERQIRDYKARAAAALSEQDRKAAQRKVRQWQGEMRQHLDDHPDLKRLRYREQIGAGNTPTGNRRDDDAGDIGAQADVTLDGTAEPTSPRPRVDEPEQPDEPAPVDPAQADILDQPEPEPETEGLPDFTTWSDDDLALALGDYGDNDEAVEAIMAEMDRRAEEADAAQAEADEQAQAEAAAEAERQRHRDKRARQREERERAQMERFDALVESGMDEIEAWAEATGQDIDRLRRDDAIARLREDGHRGRGFDELARSAYRDYVDRQYWAAEDATNGYLLSNAGELHVEDPRELFTGPEARARKWASDELKQWWDQHGRMTFDEFAAMLLGDAQAAREAGERTGGEDFLQ